MLEWESYLAFMTASILLILIPGPDVALIIADNVAYGTRRGLLTVVGTSSARWCSLA